MTSDQGSKEFKYKIVSRTLDDVDCPNCGSPVHNSSLNINNSLGKCDSCGNVFAFEKDNFFESDRPGRPEMIMPEGTDVLVLSDSLDIRVDWKKSRSKASLGFLTIFTLAWNAITGIGVASILASGFGIGLLGIAVHVIVGLSLLYWLISTYVNKTDIIVTNNEIRISHYPLKNPFNREKVIPLKDFKQFYVNKYVSSTTNGKPNYAYALYAIRHNQSKVQIIKGMNKETQLYLEQEIERFLRIKDQQVGGSIRR